MGGKNFIQNCRRVNAEKIQISVGDKVIITISNAGNVGPIRKSSISNGVNIGTTNPSQKLDVGSGNVSANDYWITAAGKWASQVSLQCVQKTLAGSGSDKNIYCDSGYTVTGGGCDVREGGDRSERWWSKPLSNGWSCHANGGVYNVYVICCK